MTAPKPLTYKDSGVDTDTADLLVDDIVTLAKSTKGPEVISGIGGFAGLFLPDWSQYQNPVLVASTDGIGTKLNLAIEYNQLQDLGQDLVAMCVNDLVCCGAKPIFFLDYFATGKLEPQQLQTIIASIAKSLKTMSCALLGGETAEMPGLYKKGDFDAAGFSVGLVDQAKIIDGTKAVQAGDVLLGLASSGVHSNGFSLVRKILEVKNIDAKTPTPFAPDGLIHALLKPTKLYVNSILSAAEKFKLHAVAHITGGGIVDNLPRVYADSLQAVITQKSWTRPALFDFLQREGNVPENEMWHVFNMGIGAVVIVAPDQAAAVSAHLTAAGETVYQIGQMQTKANAQSPSVELV